MAAYSIQNEPKYHKPDLLHNLKYKKHVEEN